MEGLRICWGFAVVDIDSNTAVQLGGIHREVGWKTRFLSRQRDWMLTWDGLLMQKDRLTRRCCKRLEVVPRMERRDKNVREKQ